MMTTIVMTHFLTCTANGKLDFRDLPSPPLIYQALCNRDFKKYKSLLLESKTILDKYAQLSPGAKLLSLKSWIQLTAESHNIFAIHFKDSGVDRNQDNLGLNQVDLSKIDLLMYRDGMDGEFRPSASELRLFYNAKNGSRFSIQANISDWPSQTKSRWLGMGTMAFTETFSFEPSLCDQGARLIAWAKSPLSFDQIPSYKAFLKVDRSF